MRPKRLLFVDDDATFLETVRDIFNTLAKGAWEISTAQNHARALAELQQHKADLVVLDIGMPVVDGIQFLRLLNRAHPGQQVVMLTGQATESNRKECLDLGALLILEKPTGAGGYDSIFAALDALAAAPASDGFRGMMRRVGLQEVLQMECLGAKSSILEIFTGKVRGRIYIHDGAIIHAESGAVQGEVALYSLLALRGGEFNLQPFAEPAHRTIEGQWEFLLMEAARLQDEAELSKPAETPLAPPPEPVAVKAPALDPIPPAPVIHAVPPEETTGHRPIDEMVLFSGAGELLYDWQSHSTEERRALLEQVEKHAGKIGSLLPVGRFDQLEVYTETEQTVYQIRSGRRLFVRNGGGHG